MTPFVSSAKPRWALVPVGVYFQHVLPIWDIPGDADGDWMTMHAGNRECWCAPRVGDDGVVVHFDRAERH